MNSDGFLTSFGEGCSTGRPAPRAIASWVEAERNAADWMRHWDFIDVAVTGGGADAGIDVRATNALAQVKFEAHGVGRPALHRLVGARGRAHTAQLLFFTGTSYSSQAKQYADEMDIALFTYALDGAMSATNGPAQRLVHAAEQALERASAIAIRPAPKPAALDPRDRQIIKGLVQIALGLLTFSIPMFST